ncbi:MAG: hypothetical protein E7223_05700 [Clostridiales bacterium]|nr:hypothetical protein [Clostridiales bacterium]
MADLQQVEKQKNRKRMILITVLIVIVIIILLLLRSCGEIPEEEERPVGDFELTDDKRPESGSQDDPAGSSHEKVPTITFAGRPKYEVSSKVPEIELRNPEGNFVDFVFTLTDVKTGKLIARTGRVPAGKYVYVNVADFYPETGVYNVAINISTYDAENGSQMNGLEQTVELTVKR